MKVKTTYSGVYGTDEIRTLYCTHNISGGFIVFFNEYGDIMQMFFDKVVDGNGLWDAMNRLWNPYVGEWGKIELKDGVEIVLTAPWEI